MDEYGWWIMGGMLCVLLLVVGGFLTLILVTVVMANRPLPKDAEDRRPRRGRRPDEGDV